MERRVTPYLVTSKNPFDPRKSRTFSPLGKGTSLSECRSKAADVMGIRRDGVALVVNGQYIPPEDVNYLIMPGDSVYAYPEMGGFISVPMLITGLIVGAVMTGVSMGLQFLTAPKPSLMPPPTPYNPSTNTDAKGMRGTLSYAYAGPMNARSPGFPIPVQYGAMRVGATVINNFIDTYGRNDVLHALCAIGEGPYESIAGNGMEEVWINNEQKLSETTGTAEFRLGEASPTVITDFEELHQVREVNTRVRECTKLLLTFENSPFVDSSIYGHNLTIYGVTQSSVHKVGSYSGWWTSGGADYIYVDDYDGWYLGANDFTIDFWMLPMTGWEGMGNTNFGIACHNDPGGGFTTGWRIRCDWNDTTNTMTFIFDQPSNGIYIQSQTFTPTLDGSTWYHIALTRQGSKWYWFIDGVDYSDSDPNNPSASCDTPTGSVYLMIGDAVGLTNFYGRMDEFHIYIGQPLYTKDFSNSLPGARSQNTGVTVLTRGDVDKVSVLSQFPYGLYHVEDDGSLTDKEVRVNYDFREEGSTWFTWEGTSQLHLSGVRNPTKVQFDMPFEVLEYSMVSGAFVAGELITGATSGKVARIAADDTLADKLFIFNKTGNFTASETINGEGGGTATVSAVNYNHKSKYEIRPARQTDDDWDTKDQSVMVWGHLDEIYRQELTYPHLGLIGLYLPASDKISGAVQSISAIASRGSITMPEWTYNGGGTTSRDTSCPAWAALDMLTNTRYGAGVDIEQLDRVSWEAWATYCNATVSGSIKRAEFHGIFDSNTTVGDAILEILKCGRAMIARWGKTYYVIIDQPGNPVQLFTVGNIRPDTLSLRFASKKNRPHAIQVEYLNSANEYIRETLTEQRLDYDTTDEPLRIEKEFLVGCVIEDQARRYALLRLQQANSVVRSVQFEAGVDAVACEPGDIIQVQHDSNALTYGGRVISATSSTITLDRKITLAESVYDDCALLLVRLDDDTLVEKEITGPWDTETDTFNISGTFSTVPEEKDVYAIGRDVQDVFEYRVTQMERTSEQHIKISAIEYVESDYYHNDYGSGSTII